jgi:Lantibiotic dehydratase, N terminus
VADAGYRIAPIFLIRMAGVPFENMEKLATVKTTQAARETIAAESRFAGAKANVEELLASRKHNLSKEQFRAWRKAVRSGIMPSAADPPTAAFVACWKSAADFAAADDSFEQLLVRELDSARQALMEAARQYLPQYLVFAASGLRDLLGDIAAGPLPLRKKSLRARERHLLLYLQRVCAKNDTLSEFGPHSWGRTDAKTSALRLAPSAGIVERETFLERWTAHGIAAAINADPVAKMELKPRLNPCARLEADRFVFSDTGQSIPLDAATRRLLARCDGTTPASSLGESRATLEKLALENLIRWEMEVPALEAHAFDVLFDDVAGWSDGPARTHWLAELRSLASAPENFALSPEPLARLAIMGEASQRLDALGAHKEATRFLYTATNPIGEECFRECQFSISERLINEVATEAAPWIDLWRDNYAFVASRVAAGLRGLLKEAPRQNGAVSLPAFLRHCGQMKMPLTGPGMIVFAHLAFQEVKNAFREKMRDRAEAAELALTAGDCEFVRQNFAYEKFDEFTYPSADLQLAAQSLEALRAGRYQWILAELHPAAALLHHGFYWSCPDKAALSAALERTLGGKPNLHFGYFAADFTATTAVRLDALPRSTKFVAPQRSIGNWQTFPPAEAEVFVDDQTGDVGVRRRGSHEYLGSLVRGWVIPLGFHPFSFSLGRHTPRLLCGNIIVQRRSWTVGLEELGSGDFTGISRQLVLAVERLRAARELPRHVYIRPTEQALRRSGAENRDKDTKPVFIDLESYLFLEIFHRWLTKGGELEVTEMLPAPDQLLWQEDDGRRTFELRTQIIPR